MSACGRNGEFTQPRTHLFYPSLSLCAPCLNKYSAYKGGLSSADYDYIYTSLSSPRNGDDAAVNVSVTMMSRRAGMLAWTPRDAFAGKKVEVVFAPERSR